MYNMDGLSIYRCLSTIISLSFLPCLTESHKNQFPYGQDNAIQNPYDSDDFDFDNLPGAQHEFKVDVAPGRRDCFFQKIKEGAQIHVSFEVLKGADRNVDVTIAGPDGQLLDKHLWTHVGSTDRIAHLNGVYSMCIDNSFSRFTGKLVYVYWMTHIEQEWKEYSEAIDDFNIKVGNVTVALTSVSKNVNKMRHEQALSRQKMVMDYYVVKNNEAYIQNLSLAMCALIVGSACVQVIFVRRLFTVSKVTPNAKPRA